MSDLENIGPKLSKINKNNPFIVPEGYFDSLPTRVQDYCQKENVKDQPIKWYYAVRTQLALATGFCFLVFFAFTGYYFTRPISNFDYFDKVDYVKMVVESGTDFDERQLYEAACNGFKKDTIKNTYKEDLIEYLLYDNVDYVTLMEHSKNIKP
ncbi:MAG: hypothetical protein AB9846_02315 [Tenuifilaceae bacterium]